MSAAEAGIYLRGLHFTIGDFKLGPLDLDIGRGEYFVLLGPNGSGKSVLIKLICGVYLPASGTVVVAGRDVTTVPPWERGIGYAPQDALLFPHLNVERNIEFALEMSGVAKETRFERVKDLMGMLGIEHLRERSVEGLSGGERQKISIARALAHKPRLLLLDEPVSAVDERARGEICRLLRQIHEAYSVATIHVCHSSIEAESVADRVGVMKEGTVADTGDVIDMQQLLVGRSR